MTKQEAIERIKGILYYMESLDADEEEIKDIEAFNMAITALGKVNEVTDGKEVHRGN